MAAMSDWDLLLSEQFKFSPTPLELIGVYLKKKILGELDPRSAPIVELDMYGKEKEKSPPNLFGGEDLPWQTHPKNPTVLYVFTHLSNVGKTGQSSNKQKSRVAGDGSWRNNKEHPVVDGNKIQIGFHRTLTYKPKQQTEGHWNMDEFAINPAAFPGELQDNCQNLVLCRIYFKSSDNAVASSKKRKSAVVADDDNSCICDVDNPSDLIDEASSKRQKRKSAVVVDDDNSCICDVDNPSDLIDEASSKRQKLEVPQEQTAYMPGYIDFDFSIPPPQFVDDYISFHCLE